MSHNHGTKPKWVGVTGKSGTHFLYKAALALFPSVKQSTKSLERSRKNATIYNSGPPRNSSLSTKVKRFAYKAVLRSMGGDISTVVASERLDEMQDPELTIVRAMTEFEAI